MRQTPALEPYLDSASPTLAARPAHLVERLDVYIPRPVQALTARTKLAREAFRRRVTVHWSAFGALFCLFSSRMFTCTYHS